MCGDDSSHSQGQSGKGSSWPPEAFLEVIHKSMGLVLSKPSVPHLEPELEGSWGQNELFINEGCLLTCHQGQSLTKKILNKCLLLAIKLHLPIA